ncbi:cellulose binding domain-containing protein [Streptomyces sp. NPDC059874]|uniref:cellulose binding domain-containing protein n=1 Tax=Streptomyces sp. NPDC059874 TaxID=3346983 RepID=UPI003650B53A
MSRARRNSRRRGGTALKLTVLLVVLIAGAGAVALYPKFRSTESAPTGLAVRYKTEGPATGAVAKPWLEVVNNSKETVALDKVTLRYYFSADDASAYGSNCVRSDIGCTNLTTRIAGVAAPDSTTSHYVQIGFAAGAGSLEPGKSSKGIALQLFRLDHKELNQANDRSFKAKTTKFTWSKQVTAYVGGTLAWGEEPAGAAPAPGQEAPASAAAAPPAGVMFDSFRYSGHDDPALVNNGWKVRSGEGGPGIADTWSAPNVSFPAEATAQGGQSMLLQSSTDGTKEGTRQAELQSTKPQYFTGTLAARVYLTDKPVSGPNGDHVVETFFAISPAESSPQYSELDFEYTPNGGWGAPGPRLDTTSWLDAKKGDRVTKAHKQSVQGWHTVVITAMDNKVTYNLDGRVIFTSDKKYFPREPMGIHFSNWFIDLPLKGARTWDMRVNWAYFQADKAVSPADVQKAVDGFYANGINYVNTMPTS